MIKTFQEWHTMNENSTVHNRSKFIPENFPKILLKYIGDSFFDRIGMKPNVVVDHNSKQFYKISTRTAHLNGRPDYNSVLYGIHEMGHLLCDALEVTSEKGVKTSLKSLYDSAKREMKKIPFLEELKDIENVEEKRKNSIITMITGVANFNANSWEMIQDASMVLELISNLTEGGYGFGHETRYYGEHPILKYDEFFANLHLFYWKKNEYFEKFFPETFVKSKQYFDKIFTLKNGS